MLVNTIIHNHLITFSVCNERVVGVGGARNEDT